MKAARIHEYGSADVLRVEDIEPPTVGARDALVEVRAARPARHDQHGAARGVATSVVVRKADGADLAQIAELVDSVYPLDRIADAHRASETGRARGKIVISVRP